MSPSRRPAPSGPWPPCFLGIVIPARDEEESVVAAVRSVRRSLEHPAARTASSWIVVVDDSSADATFTGARRALAREGEVLRGSFGTAGAARKAGFSALLSRIATNEHPLEGCWFATTDADSTVPRGWIADQLAWRRRGYDAVAGMVEPEWDDAAGPALRRRYERFVAAKGTGHGHRHVYGANLGFSAASYLRAGQMPTIATGEDHAMWAALRSTGARVISVADDPVQTSTRREGRAPSGFAALLSSLATD